MRPARAQQLYTGRIVVGIVLIFSLSFPSAVFLMPTRAEAVVENIGIGPAETGSWFENILTAISTAGTWVSTQYSAYIKPVLDGLAWSLANAILEKMTSDIVRWIQSGFDGNPAFVTNPDAFFMDVADKAIGNYIRGTDLAFLCSPFSLQIKLALALRFGAARGPACTLTGIMANVQNFLNGSFLDGGWDRWFEITNSPRNNAYGAYLITQGQLADKLAQVAGKEKSLLDWGKGVFSWKTCSVAKACPPDITLDENGKCTGIDDDGNPIDYGAPQCPEGKEQVATPGSVIQEQLNKALGSGRDKLVVMNSINQIVSALVQQLFKWVFSSDGLLGSSSTIDPLPVSNFAYSASAVDPTIPRGGSGTFDITITKISGAAEPVTLTVTPPANTSVRQITNNPCTPNPTCTVTVTLDVGSTALVATQPIFAYVTPGSLGQIATTINFNLTVTDNFSYTLATDPTTVTVSPSRSSIFTVNLSLVSVTTRDVTLYVETPAGVSASDIAPIKCAPTCESRITLVADTTAVPGTYPGLKITGAPGSNGELTQFSTYTIYIPPPGAPAITLTATPGSLPFNGGTTTLDWIVINNPRSCIASSNPPGAWARTLGPAELLQGIERGIRVTQTTTFILTCENDIGTGEGRATVATAPADLAVLCLPTPASIAPGRSTTWVALPSGGDGRYTYSWTGHSQIQGVTSNPASATYSSNGTYNGSVSVRSGNTQSIGPIACTTPLTVGPVGGSLGVQCVISPNPATTNSTLTWVASASGGDGIYSYRWDGISQINGRTENPLVISPIAVGNYGTSIAVTSEGRTISVSCPQLQVR